MKKALYQTIIVITLAILTSNCEDRSWDNPFGGDLNSEDWATNFTDSIQQAKINEAVLTWKAVNKNIDGYIIRRNINDKGEIVEPFIIKRAGIKDTSYIDEQLIPDPNLHYNYQISAYAGANESLVNDTSITPSFPAPSNFKYSILDKDLASINISWNDNSNGEDGFSIYRKYSGYDWVKILQTNEDVTAFVDHVPQSTNIQYKVEAYKDDCQSDPLYGNLNIADSRSLIFGGNNKDELNGICQTANLTYIAVGMTNSTDFAISNTASEYLNSDNALLVEFDHNLNIKSMKTFGGSGNDTFDKVVAVNDGIIILGHSSSSDYNCKERNANQHIWILKLDYDLNILWSHFYGTNSSSLEDGGDEINDIQILGNDQIVCCGYKNYNGWLLMLNQYGEIILDESSYEGSGIDEFTKITPLKTERFLVIGSTQAEESIMDQTHFGESDTWLVDIDYNGHIKWNNTFETQHNDIGIGAHYTTVLNLNSEKYENYYIILNKSLSSPDTIPLSVLNMEGTEIKPFTISIGSTCADTQLSTNAVFFSNNTILIAGQVDERTSFATRLDFSSYDQPPKGLRIQEIWTYCGSFITSEYNFSNFNDAIRSFNNNGLLVGSVSKVESGSVSTKDCWIREVDYTNGVLAP